MERKQRTITIIVALITAALLGLVWVQIILLQKAFELAKQAHAQNVNAALNRIVSKLEDRETVTHVFKAIMQPVAQKQMLTVHTRIEDDDYAAHAATIFVDSSMSMIHTRDARPFDFDPKSGNFSFTLNAPQHVRLRMLDSLGQQRVILLDEKKPAGTYYVKLDSAQKQARGYYFNFNVGSDSSTYDVLVSDAQPGGDVKWVSQERRKQLVAQVLDDLTLPQRLPIAARLQPATLDSIVRTVLQEQGVDMRYAYGIHKHATADSLLFVTPAGFAPQLLSSPFYARLFPSDVFYPHYDLRLYFPEQQFYLLKKNGGVLFSVFGLLLIIVFCFVYTLRTLFKQKQFGQLLTQFINNMTHEFKTPISTIALASEAFKSPQVLQDRDKIQRYSGIILDESQRMRSQVEKILQMAVLEEGDYELNLAQLDVHATLAEVLRNFAVQIEKRGGEVIARLHAKQTIIEADAVHFANMIHNLLDNANKYTPTTPRIVVSTESDARGVFIKIADNGVGLRAEEQRLVFDKYYRVPTGNVHDVKGFGLGLSYVKLMAEAHGGSVNVESEYQKGSAFHLYLPCVHPAARGRKL